MLAPHDIHHNNHHHHHHYQQQQAAPHDRHAPPPISRTIQYKKVTKPLLERKRRARINRCLDELKDLMVGAFEADGENVSKLEKADILELTVRHLHRLRRPRDAAEEAHRYQIGFTQCATEAYQFLLSSPGVDLHIVRRLLAHLRQRAATTATPNNPTVPGPLSVQVPVPARLCYSPPVSPASPASSPPTGSYPVVLSSTPSVQDLSRPHTGLLMTVSNIHPDDSNSPKQVDSPEQPVWRPW